MENFHFLRPHALWLLLPSFICLACLAFYKARSQQWQQWFDTDLIQPLLTGQQTSVRRWPLVGLCLVWILSCIALAGPAWVKLKQPVLQASNALVIVWDMSPSMMAADLKPNRLTRSRYKLTDLLKRRKEGQTAMVVYGGEAYVVTPLSDDTDTVLSQLPALSPDLMPIRGSNTEMAIEKALNLLKESGNSEGDILLVTDGVVPEAVRTINQTINKTPSLTVRLSVYGIGTTSGAPVPFEKGFAKDDQGDVIIDKLDTRSLRQLASQNGGQYLELTRSNRDIQILSSLHDIQALTNSDTASKSDHTLTSDATSTKESDAERAFDAWQDAGVWLLWFILPLAAFSFRRGWVFAVVLAVNLADVSTTPLRAAENTAQINENTSSKEQNSHTSSKEQNSHTSSKQQNSHTSSKEQSWWSKLWSTPDQFAEKQLQNGDFASASSAFENSDWKASANYRNGDFAQAAEQFDANTATGAYNAGNSLAKSGDLNGAIEQYESALQQQPQFPQAKENLKLVKDLLEQQQSENNSEQGDSKEQDSDSNNSDSNNSDSNNPDSNNSDSNNPDNQKNSDNQQSSNNQDSDQADAQEQNKQGDGQQGSQTPPEQSQSKPPSSDDNENSDSDNAQSQASDDSQDAQSGEEQKKEQKNPFAQSDEPQDTPDTNSEKKEQPAANTDEKENDDKEAGDEETGSNLAIQDTRTQEQQEADAELQQWLKQIPDDPSGLLKNKFDYQYRQRRQQYRRGEWELPKNKANQRL